ncbi:hypothetical protein [Paradevosia shaoguanensis]|uniref:hypothetical protein n=1 Tax=Paradevosia shaoguanensis TaxID=1335043 RepID=UPI003C73EF34
MKKLLLMTAAAITLSAGGALAQNTPDFATTDGDKSGEATLSELILRYPDVSEAQFNTADADKSGGLNEKEFLMVVTPNTEGVNEHDSSDNKDAATPTPPPAQ